MICTSAFSQVKILQNACAPTLVGCKVDSKAHLRFRVPGWLDLQFTFGGFVGAVAISCSLAVPIKAGTCVAANGFDAYIFYTDQRVNDTFYKKNTCCAYA